MPMTPAEQIFWMRAQRIAAGMRRDLAAATLRAFQIIRESLSDAELERLIRAGKLDQLLYDVFSDDSLDRAAIPLKRRLRESTERAFRLFVKDLPGGGMINGTVAVSFNVLNPTIIDAIRTLDTKVMQTFMRDTRETVRMFVEQGLRDGMSPIEVSRSLRDVVGLAPNQLDAVLNLRGELEGGQYGDAARRTLLDRRFNLKALDKLEPAARAARIDTIVDAYGRSFQAFHAETVARTAALDAMKMGQHLTWADAVDKGLVDGDRLWKRWKGVMDSREREEHVDMEGDEARWDEPFSNGQMLPGDDEYNCRCLPKYFLKAPSQAAA